MTEEGQSVARAVHVAGDVTETFVIVVRALGQAVTNMAGVKAQRVTTTAVHPRAPVGAATGLVLLTRAVSHTVASKVHRQAVPVPCGCSPLSTR